MRQLRNLLKGIVVKRPYKANRMAKLPSLLLALAAALLFTGCNREVLRMQVDNISRESLASYQIGTPDPRLIYPPVGQRLVVSWFVPIKEFVAGDIEIHIFIVYGDYSREELSFRPRQSCGMYLRTLLNENYFTKCGYLSYRSEMYASGKLIKEWRHQLFREPITFSPEEGEAFCEESDDEEE